MKITPRVALLLTVPPLLWAGNALVGRLLAPTMPPLLLNALRWWGALAVLLVLGWRVLGSAERREELRARWREMALLGLFGVGIYNALQYLALQTSTPINVTLIASSTPVWMLIVGGLFYGEKPRPMQWLGAVLSFSGVLLVLARGEPARIADLRLVAGDVWMLMAALSWAIYSWRLARPGPMLRAPQRPDWNWAEFLLGQALFGTVWATAFALGEQVVGASAPQWTPTLAAALVFLALGPSLLAYRCWHLGVTAVGPALAGFFSNLTPLFAALFSAALLGQPPQPYHGAAFALIVAGILVSNRR